MGEWQGRLGRLCGRGGWAKLSREISMHTKQVWLRFFISSSERGSLPSCLLFSCCPEAFSPGALTWFVQWHLSERIKNLFSILQLPQHAVKHIFRNTCKHTHTSKRTYLLWVRFSAVCTVPLHPRSPPGAWPSPLCHAAPWGSAAPWASSRSRPHGCPHFFGSWHKNHCWTCPPLCQLVKSVWLVSVIA